MCPARSISLHLHLFQPDFKQSVKSKSRYKYPTLEINNSNFIQWLNVRIRFISSNKIFSKLEIRFIKLLFEELLWKLLKDLTQRWIIFSPGYTSCEIQKLSYHTMCIQERIKCRKPPPTQLPVKIGFILGVDMPWNCGSY